MTRSNTPPISTHDLRGALIDRASDDFLSGHDTVLASVAPAVLAYAYERHHSNEAIEHLICSSENFESNTELSRYDKAWISLYLGRCHHTSGIEQDGWLHHFELHQKDPDPFRELEAVQGYFDTHDGSEAPLPFLGPAHLTRSIVDEPQPFTLDDRMARNLSKMAQRGDAHGVLSVLEQECQPSLQGRRAEMRWLCWFLGAIDFDLLNEAGLAKEARDVLMAVGKRLSPRFSTPGQWFFAFLLKLQIARAEFALGNKAEGFETPLSLAQWMVQNPTVYQWLDHLDLLTWCLYCAVELPVAQRVDIAMVVLDGMCLTTPNPTGSDRWAYRYIKLRMLEQMVGLVMAPE